MNIARLIRFGLVGVVNTAIYYGMYLLLRTQVPYIVAHVCAFVFAMICSYFLNCYVTFRTPPRWKTFALFPLSNLANFMITTFGLRLSVSILGVDERIAPLPVAVVAIPITYVVTHYIMLGRLRTLGTPSALPMTPECPTEEPGSPLSSMAQQSPVVVRGSLRRTTARRGRPPESGDQAVRY